MYSTCLHCTRDLGSNDVLETLPIGRRVAFDAAQGRLWVVCRSCAKWNLVPFDTRLETIDACERIFRETRTRFSTENIGLARARDGMDLVRIGVPQRPEFASWRYGAQYRRRRRVNLAIAGAGLIATSAANIGLNSLVMTHSSLLVDVPISMAVLMAVTRVGTHLQNLRQRVLTTIPGVPGVAKIDHDTALSAHLASVEGEMAVSWSPGVIAAMRKRRVTVSGPDTRLLVRRILGLINRSVGSAKELDGAVERVETGGLGRWLSRLGSESVEFVKLPHLQRLRLTGSMVLPWVRSPGQPARNPGFDSGSFLLISLPRPDRLALEMWLSEEDEAKALAGELSLLERQWKEAEELAKIADSLAVSDDVHEKVGG